MRKDNGITVYEETDKCALDEYSEQLAKDIEQKFKNEAYNDTKIKQEIVDIQTEQKNQNINIELLQKENAEIKEENNRLKEDLNALPTVSGSGEYVTLDTADSRFKDFKIFGKSEQETRSGKNLLNWEKIISDSEGVSKENGYIKFTQASQRLIIQDIFETNEQYSIKLIAKKDIAGVVRLSVIYDDDTFETIEIKCEKVNTEYSNTITTKAEKTVKQIRSYYADGDVSYIKIEGSQIEKGAVSSEYEQYGTKPSIKFPSEIRNVGGNINIFNKNGNFRTNGTNVEVLDRGIRLLSKLNTRYGYAYTVLGKSELLGKTIVAHSDLLTTEGVSPNMLLYFGTEVAPTSGGMITKTNSQSQNEGLWNIPSKFPDGSDSIRIFLYIGGVNPAPIGATVDYNNLKVEIGKASSIYSEYSYGNSKITICNKNLLDQNLELFQGNYDNNGNVITNSDRRIDKYIFLAKGNYIFWSTSNNWINVLIYDKNKKLLSVKNSNTNKELAFTLDEDGYIRFGFNPIVESLAVFQLERNSTKTANEEHKEQAIIFPFKKGQRLMEGDYLAEDEIHHKRKQTVLDGTENWVTLTAQKGDNTSYFYCTKTDMKKASSIICNQFINRAVWSTDVEGIQSITDNLIRLRINTSRASTVSELKACLAAQKEAGTPVLIEYELAEEEVEPYTEAQKEAWKQIKNARSYEGQTNIFSTDEISPNFEVTARRNLNAILNSLQAQILAN